MDVLTAGVALVLVQLCVAIFMAGTFYAAPDEKCTRFWAQSGVLTGLGLLMVVVNAGAPNYALLIISNNTLIGGLIFQWLGIRAFYKRGPSAWGWGIAVIFFLAYGLLLIMNANVVDRVVLSATTTTVVFILNFLELRKNRTARSTFASVLAMCALTGLIASSALRVIGNLWGNPAFLPTTTSSVGIEPPAHGFSVRCFTDSAARRQRRVLLMMGRFRGLRTGSSCCACRTLSGQLRH